MITALFPAEGAPITITQGKTGDCYLLASLDCVFNSGPVGLAKIKALFTETDQGVTVRLKRSAISSNLRVSKLAGKYNYHYDKARDDDVFIISKERLKIIDGPSIGVKTNSLAVKIIERLSSYYYVNDWDNGADLMASVVAHNVPNRHEGTSTAFMGQLLGIETEDLKDIDTIIRLKAIDPNYPVYISMSYGVKDEFGKTHGRHGLRLDKIKCEAGSYQFILVNPWDNNKTESFSLDDIKTRNVRFCLFHLPSPQTQLTKRLLELPVDDGLAIAKIPSLMMLLEKLQALKPSLSVDNVKHVYALYKNMPTLTTLLQMEKDYFQEAMFDARGDKERFLKLLLTGIPRLEVAKYLIINEKLSAENTLILIDRCIKEKDKTLFSLLKHSDFLAHLPKTGLDKNLFLSHLIELQLDQEQVHFDSLLAIVRFIRQVNLNSFGPLTLSFTEKDIFNAIVLRAIKEKAQTPELNGNIEVAKKIVELGLIQYYLTGNLANLTRSGALRSLFMKLEFPKSLIEDISSPEWGTRGTIQFLKSSQATPGLQKKLAKDQHLTSKQLDLILQEVESEKPRKLFCALHALSIINNGLATVLHHLLRDQFTLRFTTLLSTFESEIRAEEPSDFQQWFIAAIPVRTDDTLKEQARLKVSECFNKIELVSVVFQSLYSQELVNKAVHEARCILTNIVHEHSVQEALKLLDVQEARETTDAIIAASAQKIKVVQEAADQRNAAMNKAEAVILEYISKVKSFSFSYDHVHLVSYVETEKRSFYEMLDILGVEPQLQEALHVLGTQDFPTILIEAFKEKKDAINDAALVHQEQLAQAEAVITKMIDTVKQLSVSFSELSSTTLLTQRSSQQLEYLYSLTYNKEVIKAQKILGFKDHNAPKLMTAIERKAQIIIEATEEQIIKINEVHHQLLIRYEKQLKEFTFSFKDQGSVEEIEAHKQHLQFQLAKLVDHQLILDALKALQMNDIPEGIMYNLVKTQESIKSAALNQEHVVVQRKEQEHLDAQRKEQEHLDAQRKEQEHLETQCKEQERLEAQRKEHLEKLCCEKALKKQQAINITIRRVDIILSTLKHNIGSLDKHHFSKAFDESNILLQELKSIRDNFLSQLQAPGIDLKAAAYTFKTECRKAIDKATPLLERDLSWGDYLINVLKLLANTVINLFTSNPHAFYTPVRSASVGALENTAFNLDVIEINKIGLA